MREAAEKWPGDRRHLYSTQKVRGRVKSHPNAYRYIFKQRRKENLLSDAVGMGTWFIWHMENAQIEIS